MFWGRHCTIFQQTCLKPSSSFAVHVLFYAGTLGFNCLFAINIVMEYVAIVGNFGAVLGGVISGSQT